MSPDYLLELKEELIRVCSEVAVFIRGEIDRVSDEDIEEKDRNSLVSYVDTRAEEIIVERLSSLLPQAGFVTEEDITENNALDTHWIIDPLDGTTNYLHKIPHFSTSIALSIHGEVVLGIVYEIMLDIAYTAVKGSGAWENNRLLRVNDIGNPEDALIVTGFPYKRNKDIDENIALLKHCIKTYRGMRRLGSAALDLAYVAAGKIDIYYERSLNIWDLAAGALIVQEAGGVVTDYEGGNHFLESGQIIASNTRLHPGILKAVQDHLK